MRTLCLVCLRFSWIGLPGWFSRTGHVPDSGTLPAFAGYPCFSLCLFQVGISECNETLAAEARLVARMNDPCRQFAQSQHCTHVIGHIRVVQIVDQRTVVNGVA